MSTKNILVTIDWFLPGTNAGGPVRSIANLVDQLKEFNFYILTTNKDYCSDQPYENITSDQWIERSENVKVYYFSKAQLSKENMTAVMLKVDCKLIYINGIYSKYFSRIPLKIAKKNNLKAIVTTRGMLSPHALDVKRLKKTTFLKVQNTLRNYKKIHFHVTNEQEQKDVEKIIRKFERISVIPNLPRVISEAAFKSLEKEKGNLKLISLGRIAEEKGTMVSLHSLKRIEGDVELDLYGTIYNQEYWKKCKTIVKELPKTIKVNYCGELSADEVHDKLQEYHFLLLPSKGENYGHSIVESFCSGRPVIISKNTPWKALEKEKAGFDMEESGLSIALQKAVDMNQSEFNEWSKNAYQKGTKIANDPTIIEKYKQLFTNH